MKAFEHGDAHRDDQQIIIDIRQKTAVVDITPTTVPFLDLPQQHRSLESEILDAWTDLLSRAAFIGGDAVSDFEKSLADYVTTDHAVGVANGTDAIMLALKALGIKDGDEVITAANTFFATVEAITHAGGVPVLVDVDPDTATIDPAAIEAAVTPRTRFIVPVHLYGQPADMLEIMRIAAKHDLKVVEDNAQAIGARYRDQRTGSIGHAGATSFYPGKNLGATGDGGAVTTNDEDVADRVRMFASHGSRSKYDHVVVGYNSRLDAIHAAALSVKLRHLDTWNARRRHVADRYATLMDQLNLTHPTISTNGTHVFHLYVVRVDDRDEVQTRLAQHGIATGLHYPTPIHLTKPFTHLGHGNGTFPVSESWASNGLSLPMFPEMTEDQIQAVATAMNAVLGTTHVLTRNTA
ncbi:MAG: DegT/DnrJ/EryC1/StrS family aminotransferase [Actinomycetia bacterium]|nr:DegT/DnrJ/EryC1/StrS family aminotransferase [Actinomycetes bacterium]